ncbi:hypothetical protein, partial [Achromobacter animicus]|uniref:hypothetical protein n=1 Tax=Achromobacter animicus TaxID=1389935 RepID=UPI0028B23D82
IELQIPSGASTALASPVTATPCCQGLWFARYKTCGQGRRSAGPPGCCRPGGGKPASGSWGVVAVCAARWRGGVLSSVVLGVLLAAGADVFCPLMRFSARCDEAVACVYATISHCPRGGGWRAASAFKRRPVPSIS